jgi:hypothetical protein
LQTESKNKNKKLNKYVRRCGNYRRKSKITDSTAIETKGHN